MFLKYSGEDMNGSTVHVEVSNIGMAIDIETEDNKKASLFLSPKETKEFLTVLRNLTGMMEDKWREAK